MGVYPQLLVSNVSGFLHCSAAFTERGRITINLGGQGAAQAAILLTGQPKTTIQRFVR